MLLSRDAVPREPVLAVALGAVLLDEAIQGENEVLAVHVPEPTAAFSRRDTRNPGFGAAVQIVTDLGFIPVVRPHGGTLAAYHSGSVVVDHVVRTDNPQAGVESRFERFAAQHLMLLRSFGLKAQIGQIPGEYCPGQHSLNVPGVGKVAGSAQRVTRNGWLFSTVVQVTNSSAVRDVLEEAYRALGYELNRDAVGSIEDAGTSMTSQAVASALLASYRDGREMDGLEISIREELPRVVTEALLEHASRFEPFATRLDPTSSPSDRG